MMMGSGHMWAVGAIVALVLSTAFLVWLDGKEGSPHQKFGKIIAWIAIVFSALMILGSIVMCIGAVAGGHWPPCMRGGMMQPMQGQGPMQFGPGLQRPQGPGLAWPGMKMGPMQTPQEPEKK